MRTTFDAEADAVCITLVPEIAPRRSVRNEIIATASGAIAMDFDQAGMLLGVEVLGATKLLDREFLARAERIDQQ